MANTIEYENIDKELKYTNLSNPQVFTGFPLSLEPYEVEDGKLKKHPKSLINAIDINWGGASVKETPINTTDDLLYLLNNADFGGGGNSDGGGSVGPIDPNSMIYIMLNAIRALQNEVTRLRNSFRFGINSYSGEEFGMRETVNDLSTTKEEEPLWATDESELEFIEGLDLSQGSYQYISPIENFEILPNDRLKYNGNIIFTIPQDSNGKNILEVSVDPKHYAYITSSTKDIDIILKSGEKTLSFNIKDIVEYQYAPEKYNILVIVSKKVEYKNENERIELVGNNFVWVSVSEWGTGTELFNGYISENSQVDEEAPETPIYLNDIYNLDQIQFHTDSEDYIYKLDIYSNYYQDFTKPITGAPPVDVEDYKYRTAAITIRSMSTEEKIKNHIKELQNNELIFCEGNKKLFIYTNGNLINIGSGGNVEPGDEDIMENYEILKALEEQGLITITFIDGDKMEPELKYDSTNVKTVLLSNKFNISENLNAIEKINFINGDTGKSFDVTMSPYGEFNIKETLTDSMEKYITKPDNTSWFSELPDDFLTDRGFVSSLKAKKKNKDITKDLGLNGEHIRIGAVYAPKKSDKIHGCTHGYIELCNSSNEDFYLDGCKLHYSYVANPSTSTEFEDVQYEYLDLDGYIPKGGTYLIRCKQYSTIDDPNTFIDVKTYDKEWYIGQNELLDLSIDDSCSLGLALTYGITINQATKLSEAIKLDKEGIIISGVDDAGKAKGIALLKKGLIDSFYIGADWGDENHWVLKGKQGFFSIKSNSICKVTFELDPAKQACNSWTTTDTSRTRWQNSATDYQYVNLDREYIEFYHSDEKKAVADYTPKASFEHKNVITDKSSLNKNKPNAISCSYGIDAYTTRCFNWVSNGLFNEAVFIIDPDTNKEYKFESYKNVKDNTNYNKYVKYIEDTNKPTNPVEFVPTRKEFPFEINNIVYGSGHVITNLDQDNEIREYGLEFDSNGNPLRSRLYNLFPGNNEPYTSHKCIVSLVKNAVTTPKTYQYYICRLDKHGNKDESYKSDIRTFTLYPKSYQPRIYQITDQQGFHWIEYQAWAAAAKKLNEKIQQDQVKDNIMPIIINTGDAVQSGARVNEWLDYYSAGDYLFSHYEQNNIVGNNDLCDINVNELGTGNDTGKSNSYFFHIFNCYEIPIDEYKPIINNVYVPSLYYIDIVNNNKNVRILFINSEITKTCCGKWFNLKNNGKEINIYTGFTVANPQVYSAIRKYTQEEVNTYNLTLDGALQYGAIKIAAVEGEHFTQEEIDAAQEGDEAYGKTVDDWKVEPVEEVLYSDDEVNTNNGTLPGAKTIQDNLQLFHPIYDILWQWTNIPNTSFLPVCHEMPFTVITNACLSWNESDNNQFSNFRSLSDVKKLIGSHTNQIDASETGKGMHWMSRLFEFRNITLCLGGHKHTYACTYPARENYLYIATENKANEINSKHLIKDENNKLPNEEGYITTYENEYVPINIGDTLWSYKNGPMDMDSNLINDSAIWEINITRKYTSNNAETTDTKKINLTKFPIVKRPSSHKSLDRGSTQYEYDFNENKITIQVTSNSPYRFYPFMDSNTNDTNPFVIYFMCQATGYKLTSNKELPSEFQKFSMVIPKSYINSKGADAASSDQLMPMFGIIDIIGNNKYYTQLGRFDYINGKADKSAWQFTQESYSKNPIIIEYLIMSPKSINGLWAYYDNKTQHFVQMDTYSGSKITQEQGFVYCEGTTNEFVVDGNDSVLLYPSLITQNEIYLFVVDNTGLLSQK